MKPLIVLSGLPGAGKSALAGGLAARLAMPVLAVDRVDGVLMRRGEYTPPGVAAYEIVGALAAEQLKLGLGCIVDAVNGVEAARSGWRLIAAGCGARLIVIECVCSDVDLHRRRLDARQRDIAGLPEPTWADVEARSAEFEPWPGDRLLLDSARLSLAERVDSAARHVLAAPV